MTYSERASDEPYAADYRMLFLMMAGRMEAEVARCCT